MCWSFHKTTAAIQTASWIRKTFKPFFCCKVPRLVQRRPDVEAPVRAARWRYNKLVFLLKRPLKIAIKIPLKKWSLKRKLLSYELTNTSMPALMTTNGLNHSILWRKNAGQLIKGSWPSNWLKQIPVSRATSFQNFSLSLLFMQNQIFPTVKDLKWKKTLTGWNSSFKCLIYHTWFAMTKVYTPEVRVFLVDRKIAAIGRHVQKTWS